MFGKVLIKKPKVRWRLIFGIFALAGCLAVTDAVWTREVKIWKQKNCWTNTESIPNPNGNFIAKLEEETCNYPVWTVSISTSNSLKERSHVVFISQGYPQVAWIDAKNLGITLAGTTIPTKFEHSSGTIKIKYFVDRKMNEQAFKQRQDLFESTTLDNLARHISTFTGNGSAEQNQKALAAMMARTWHDYEVFSAWRRANAEFANDCHNLEHP